MAAVNIPEEDRHLLVRPYMQWIKKKSTAKTENEPFRTKEETVSFIFEGI